MVEGAGSHDWRTLKTMLYARPELLHRILEVNARAVTDYLNAQIEAGAQAVMIFDTWGGILSYDDYEKFSLSYCRRIFEKVLKQREGARVPSILFTKGGSPWLAAMMTSGCDAVGLDWTADAREARRVAAGKVALQGNLDPSALFASHKSVREAARSVLDAFGAAPGHVFNLGHGVAPQTPVDAVSALVDEVRAYSRSRRSRIAAGT
jgi:uroporphyrinogen decarboxylase